MITISASSTISGDFSLSGGTLSGQGVLTITGNTTWTGGTMSGTGRTVARGGLTLGGSSGGNSRGYQEFLDGRELDNYGSATLDISTDYGQGHLYLRDGAVLVNESGASFDFVADGTFVDDGGGAPDGGTFVNDGTISKTGGTGNSQINVTLT